MYIWDLLMHLPLQLGHLYSWCFDINDLSSVLWHWFNQFFTKELLKGCPGQRPLNLTLLKHNIRGYKLISWGLSCTALSNNNTRLLSWFQTLPLVQFFFCLASRFVYWVSGIFLFLVVLGGIVKIGGQHLCVLPLLITFCYSRYLWPKEGQTYYWG